MLRSKISFILVLISFLTISCEKIDLGKEVTVKIGEKNRISWNISFEIDSINDYRCPNDADCIWAGDVDILLNSGGTVSLLKLYDSESNPTTIEGYIITAINVDPYPVIGVDVDQSEYEIRLQIDKE